MKKNSVISIVLIAALALVVSGFSFFEKVNDHSLDLEEISLPGATVLAFGPGNVLFIGDSKAAVIHAIPTKAEKLEDAVPFNLTDFDLKLAKVLEIEARDLIINDMKIHPVSQEAYFAVKKGHAPDATSMIAIVSPTDGEIRFLEVNASNSTKVAIKNPAPEALKFWRDIPASTLTITDIDYYDGQIYVAGLSNGEFASTLRKITYPFSGKQEETKSLEVYHAVHTQMETRAPIRTMAIAEVAGEPTLIASYTCTPLVTLPLSQITDGNAIKGKTIAELGYGNTPIDMITYMTQEQDGSMDQKLLITHKHRSGSLISMKDVGKAATEGKGMEGMMAQMPTGTAGMNITYSPTASVLHVDNQNQMMVATLKRNLETGGLDMVSQLKGAFLRLSEFISEYDFPSYQYDEKQAATKQFHDMVKPMEGYPELVSEKTKE
ncbi:hypothetical protein [Ulvibacterium sp.]|uniref:hypothetical protein n=1 Tax=Ulvibacterium sp. TaxID=2665914 RepID=UPI003CC6CA92